MPSLIDIILKVFFPDRDRFRVTKYFFTVCVMKQNLDISLTDPQIPINDWTTIKSILDALSIECVINITSANNELESYTTHTEYGNPRIINIRKVGDEYII